MIRRACAALAALCALAGGSPVAAQDIGLLVGSIYEHVDPAQMEIDGCKVRSTVRRTLTLEQNFKWSIRIFGRMESLSKRCDSYLRSLELQHAIGRDHVGAADGTFHGVVVRSSDADQIGEKQSGKWQILNGGHTLVLTYATGERQAFQATNLQIAKPQKEEFGVPVSRPNRTADITLVCTLLRQETYCSYAESTRSVEVWLRESVCNDRSCRVSSDSFNWSGPGGTGSAARVNRITGQMETTCGTYQCAATTPGQRKF